MEDKKLNTDTPKQDELKQVGERFTKGEWAIRDLEIIGPYGTNKSICEITGNYMDETEAKANAELIVSAPRLHEENKTLKSVIEKQDKNLSELMEQRNILLDALKKVMPFVSDNQSHSLINHVGYTPEIAILQAEEALSLCSK